MRHLLIIFSLVSFSFSENWVKVFEEKKNPQEIQVASDGGFIFIHQENYIF